MTVSCQCCVCLSSITQFILNTSHKFIIKRPKYQKEIPSLICTLRLMLAFQANMLMLARNVSMLTVCFIVNCPFIELCAETYRLNKLT